jgi:ureidoglycolate hydrolase
MKTIKYSDVDASKFSKFGYICNLLKPEGERISDDSSVFYRDMIQLGYYTDATASVCQLAKRPMIIEGAEYHSLCGEVILALDGDIIIPIAPALPDQRSPAEFFEAFYLKKGTMVYLRQGVWHSAAFPVDSATVNLLIILPERTYAKDCHVMDFDEAERIMIEAA